MFSLGGLLGLLSWNKEKEIRLICVDFSFIWVHQLFAYFDHIFGLFGYLVHLVHQEQHHLM
jgi:hypothetical protein